MHHLLVRSIICWCDLNKMTYDLDDDEGYSITCIICWCERSIICWCDLNQGPRSHSKCLSARISQRFLSSVSALKSWRQEKYQEWDLVPILLQRMRGLRTICLFINHQSSSSQGMVVKTTGKRHHVLLRRGPCRYQMRTTLSFHAIIIFFLSPAL